MKSCFPLFLVSLSALLCTACNSGDQSAPGTAGSLPAKDSAAGSTNMPAPIAYEDSIESVPRAEWPVLQTRNHLKNAAVTNTISGDFNGDGKPESVYLVAPTEDTTSGEGSQECFGGCDSYLLSSDASMPVLIVHNNLGGDISNVGDMDGDGADDLLVYPAWWQSNWNPYRLYTVRKTTGEWCSLTEPVSVFAPDLYDNKKPLVRRSKKPGYVTAFTSDMKEDGVKSAYRDVKIIK